MRVLQIGADRSKRGILNPGSPAYERQKAYAKRFGNLDIIGFSRISDGAVNIADEQLRIYPTNSRSRWHYLYDAVRIAKTLPRPEVISAQDPFETGLAAWMISRRFKIPLHVQVHTDFLAPEYASFSTVNWLRVRLAGLVLRRAASVRVVSIAIKERIEKKYGLHVPISVMPIFVDVLAIRGSRSDSLMSMERAFDRFDKKLLFVGRLEPEKNPHLAVQAFAEAAPERTCLIVVGGGSQLKSLKEFAKNKGLLHGEPMVFFEEEAESLKYYPVPDLVLVTSKYEGYGLVIIEALAAGKPVLSTDVGIAREAGAIVTDEAHFAEALKQWFVDGPRVGILKNYPYADFADYVGKYCDDIQSVV